VNAETHCDLFVKKTFQNYEGFHVLVKERDEAKADLANEILTHHRASAMYNDVEKERNEFKAANKNLEGQILKHCEDIHPLAVERNALKAELARVKDDFSKYIESHVSVDVWDDIRAKFVAAEHRAKEAERKLMLCNTCTIRIDRDRFEKTLHDYEQRIIVRHEVDNSLELTSLKDMFAQQQRANENLAGIAQPGMEPHVPRWAGAFFAPLCRGCKKASRLRALLGLICGCVAGMDGCKYEPRYTRQQLRNASTKGQLKDALRSNKEKQGLLDNAKGMIEYGIGQAEQKAKDEVAKTVEKDSAILAANDAKWGNLVKRLEEKVAASVPLANAIKTNDESRVISVPSWGTGGKPVVSVVAAFGWTDDHEVKRDELVLYKKAKEGE
jgi:hypothetical protein